MKTSAIKKIACDKKVHSSLKILDKIDRYFTDVDKIIFTLQFSNSTVVKFFF